MMLMIRKGDFIAIRSGWLQDVFRDLSEPSILVIESKQLDGYITLISLKAKGAITLVKLRTPAQGFPRQVAQYT